MGTDLGRFGVEVEVERCVSQTVSVFQEWRDSALSS